MAVIRGTQGDDELEGTPGADRIFGGAGNDVLLGLGGRDRLVGGGGDDELDGGPGRDRLVGGGGSDILSGGRGADIILGGRGADVLDGGAGADVLASGPGRDRVVGGGGDDILSGRAGRQRLVGGPGDDELDGGAGRDRVIGGRGADVFLVSSVDGGFDIFADFRQDEDDSLDCSPLLGDGLLAGRLEDYIRVVVITAEAQPGRLTTQQTVIGTQLLVDPDGPGDEFDFEVAAVLRGVELDPESLQPEQFGIVVSEPPDDPGVSIQDASVAEGDAGTTTVRFDVTLTRTSDQPVTVDFEVRGDTATAAQDFVARSGTVTFQPGETAATIDVAVVGDTRDEPNENFQVVLSNPSGADIVDGMAVGTIRNDDAPPVLPGLSIADLTLPEGDDPSVQVRFDVALSGPSNQPVIVDWTYRPIQNAVGEASGQVRFDPGQTAAVIEFPFDLRENETVPNEDSIFEIVLSNPRNATIADGVGRGIVRDDDEPIPLPELSITDAATVDEGDEGTVPASFTVTLAQASNRPVTVDFEVRGDTATAGEDFRAPENRQVTIPQGETTATIAVAVLGDTQVEPNETFQVVLSNASGATIQDGTAVGTIRNDDTPLPELRIGNTGVDEGDEGTVPASFTVTLAQASNRPVTVDFEVRGDTATAAQDFVARSGTVTFQPGETEATIAVDIQGDTQVEPNENFQVVLSNASGATIQDGTAVGTIRDDDPPVVLPELGIADLTLPEGNERFVQVQFTVTLSQPSEQPVTVDWTYQPLENSSGQASGIVRFDPGQTTAFIEFPFENRGVRRPTAPDPEGDSRFEIALSNPQGATIQDGTAVGTIRDDDEVVLNSLALTTDMPVADVVPVSSAEVGGHSARGGGGHAASGPVRVLAPDSILIADQGQAELDSLLANFEPETAMAARVAGEPAGLPHAVAPVPAIEDLLVQPESPGSSPVG